MKGLWVRKPRFTICLYRVTVLRGNTAEAHIRRPGVIPCTDRGAVKMLLVTSSGYRQATDIRCNRNPKLQPDICLELDTLLHNSNQLIQLYKTAEERLRERVLSEDTVSAIINPRLEMVLEIGADRRRENLSTVQEIAVIISDEYD